MTRNDTRGPGGGREPGGAPGIAPRLSSFVGRRRELGELRRLLPRTRILTLIGPGGCGKTRLAAELAQRQRSRFADGSILVDLATVREPGLVPDALARAAGVTLDGGDPLATLRRRMRERSVLLLMDNCEHLVEPVAELVATLLPGCPRAAVLATSRERLNVEGETVWRVPPLDLPAPELPAGEPGIDALLAADAPRLFVDRARSVRPAFRVDGSNVADVVAVCRRLDGMPLPIELAAARVSSLEPAEILRRLEDRFALLTGGTRGAAARQRTLRATIDWSFELLDAEERILLRRLSIFPGDFGADAIQEICALPPLDAAAVLQASGRLVDKSMLQAEPAAGGTMRYRLLETIREYGAEKLAASGEAHALRDRHLAHYTRLAVAAERRRRRHGAMAEHRRLWHEIADVRAALEWSARDPEAELQLLASLRLVWWIYAPQEGLRRLTEVLERPRAQRAPGVLAVAIATWTGLAGRAGRLDAAGRDRARQVGELAALAGDDFLLAAEHLGLGYEAERIEGDLERARRHLHAAVAALERLDPSPDLAEAYCSLGGVEIQLGDLEAARPLIQRGLDLARALDDDYGLVGACFCLGWLELAGGAPAEARAACVAGLDAVADGDLLSIAFQVEGVACADAAADPERALVLLGAAARMRVDVATALGRPWAPWVERAIATARTTLPARAAGDAWARGLAMPARRAADLARREVSPRDARPRDAPGGLSRRELEVARLVAAGLTNRRIAERLILAERTVESHLEHIMTKLDFGSRAQVATWVTEHRLGDAGDGRAAIP